MQRLSEELGTLQRQSGGSPTRSAADQAAAAKRLANAEESSSGTLPPSWLVEQRHMSPLLVAYDARITGLEGQLAARAGDMRMLAAQVDEVVVENESLQGQLRDAMELVALKARFCLAPLPCMVLRCPGFLDSMICCDQGL